MNETVTYQDFPAMGIYSPAPYIRQLTRSGKFPKPVKGAGIIGPNGKLHWDKKEVEKWLAGRKKRKPPAT